MSRFNIGDKVIALTNPTRVNSQPRVKGQMYIVQKIMYCSNCGIQMINIDPKSILSIFNCTCNNDQPCDGYHFTQSVLFAKVDDLEEELKEAVHNEDYELASILRNVKLV